MIGLILEHVHVTKFSLDIGEIYFPFLSFFDNLSPVISSFSVFKISVRTIIADVI